MHFSYGLEGSRVKINIDASVKEGTSYGAFVVRDAAGFILHYQAKALLCSLVLEAEVKTLEWATSVALEKNWDHIDWSMDAKNVVELINSDKPGECETQPFVTNIRARLHNLDWNLCWNARCTNCLADAVAKIALKSKADFFFLFFLRRRPS